MTTIYFVRHGQSEANKQGIIQGHAEFPLSDLGEKQAELVGNKLADLPLDAVYTSDLQRAFFTAKQIAKHHELAPAAVSYLREVGLGPLEGKTREQMRAEFPDMKNESLLTSGIKGTEQIEEITERCRIATESLKNSPGKSIAAVSHGGLISILLMYMIAGEDWHLLKRPFVIGNTGITKVEVSENGPKIHYMNQTAHLELEENLQSSTVVY
ncbi:histidine phosphatase family protein [Salisediminibacterium halotolerans]|uniref:histidine phosphatase family protein n=1 Tax=Salisediminibacterium halotolerans TaxID=517425 RepID=UPI000EAD80A4|nr:histidine phosphatase family protein [Salisediminibacterium halotolerans]RLJ69262.1 putative phosphatase [Actinophytocola xinjiangensis]RPE87003.1 putative phosphatase [Salisediminibacterium halotolerans]TWG32264.1 putative phosphatase [Salisediminibacterium halotolerans]GEL07997.1 phosphoglycerate mutase [Salisediminibacterium halotolerans]